MAAITLRTRCSLFAPPLRWARPSNPSVYHASCVHLNPPGQIGRREHVCRYTSCSPPRRDHALTTERIAVPSISSRNFSLTSSLSAVGVEQTLKHPLSIRILPSKPHHAYQKRELEVRNIQARFDELKKDHGGNCVVGVYVEGGPASGKTQLAREFGEWYFKRLTVARNIGGTTAVVATLSTRSPDSFLRSYLRLAEDLGFPLNKYNMPGNVRDRVRLISIDVQKALAETAPNWLLIIDNMDPGSKLMWFQFVAPTHSLLFQIYRFQEISSLFASSWE